MPVRTLKESPQPRARWTQTDVADLAKSFALGGLDSDEAISKWAADHERPADTVLNKLYEVGLVERPSKGVSLADTPADQLLNEVMRRLGEPHPGDPVAPIVKNYLIEHLLATVPPVGASASSTAKIEA